MENIEYYQNIAYEDIEANAERNDKYAKNDKMINLDFTLPAEITALDFIGNRKFISHAPSNAAFAAVRTFSALMPDIQIDPQTPDEGEWERVEKMETAMAWHFEQLNKYKQQSVLLKIVQNAVWYCNVSMQTVYLPYAKKKQTGKRVKNIKRRGDFDFIVHHPSNVNARWSNDGLECVTLCQERTAYELVQEFGEENEGIKKFLKDLASDKDEKGYDLRETVVAFYDYTDWDDRVIWFTDAQNGSMSERASTEDPYIIEKKAHGLPFIPWVVVDNKQPLLNNIYDTWANANIVKTIIFSKHVALAGMSAFAVELLSENDNVDIDTSSPLNILKLKPGQKVIPLPPLNIDPQLSKTEADLDSEIYASSAASILGSVERLSGQGDSFSSMNAILQAAVRQLDVVKLTAEQALTEGIHQVFRWIKYSDEPLKAYRSVSKDTSRDDLRAGSQIAIMPGNAPEDITNPNEIYFDPDELYINVKLQANTIQDEQGKITNEINKVERLGFSKQSAMENIGGQNFEREQGQRAAEMLFENEINLEIQKKQIELQLWQEEQQAMIQAKVQQQMQEAQRQAEADAQAQQQNPQNANQDMNAAGAFAGMEGMDTRGGGLAPQASAPGVGREQMNQADANGVPLE